jgi:hypothetical protein
MPVFSGTARSTGKSLKTDIFSVTQAKLAAHLKDFRVRAPAVKTVETGKATQPGSATEETHAQY